MHTTSVSGGRKNTTNLPAVKKTKGKFPGMGDTVRSPNKPIQNKSSRKKNDSVAPLKPVVSGGGARVKTNSSGGMEVCGNNRISKSQKSDAVGSSNVPREHLERTESFSKYKPLPAITNATTENKMCNKRTFETWNNENSSTEETVVVEKDILSDTIKRMKLGNDVESVACSSKKVESEKVCIRNPFDANERKKESTFIKDTKPGPSNINLIIRLPDGQRLPHSFSSNDTLGSVVEYLSKAMKKKIDLKTYVLYTNEVPKRELKNRRLTLVAHGVQDKSVLALDTRDT